MIRVPAEFEQQSFILIIFPHEHSDWIDYLEEARNCFVEIVNAIITYQKVVLICDDVTLVKSYFTVHHNITFIKYLTDDTWARDCSAISRYHVGAFCDNTKDTTLVDFTFNGWGGKFEASKDNLLTRSLGFQNSVQTLSHELEGGAIESNGNGVLLTTSECLLNPNRTAKSKSEVEHFLNQVLGFTKFLWLDHGYLAGDDTDSHIDTLARFVDEETIMYVKCHDKNDEHYEALSKMERQLKSFEGFRLIALPMTNPIYHDEEYHDNDTVKIIQQRLPATYANFLIINGAVLVPTYNDSHDKEVLAIFKAAFPYHDIIGIDCSVLIKQHGSLHCVTMQFAHGVSF